METLIVVIIIVILASLAIANYGKAKENVLNKEAFSNLRLIQVAEKGYYLDNMPNYYPLPAVGSDSNIVTINSNLRLNLTTTNWTYKVWSTGCVQATRYNGPDTRGWYLTIVNLAGDPVSTPSCP